MHVCLGSALKTSMVEIKVRLASIDTIYTDIHAALAILQGSTDPCNQYQMLSLVWPQSFNVVSLSTRTHLWIPFP